MREVEAVSRGSTAPGLATGAILWFDRHHPSVPTCAKQKPSRAAAVKDGPSSGHRAAARSVLDRREHDGTLDRVGGRARATNQPSKTAHAAPSKSVITLTADQDASGAAFRPKPLQCWFAALLARRPRSTCAKSMAGKRSPQNQSLSQLTSPPDKLCSNSRSLRYANSNHIPDGTNGASCTVCHKQPLWFFEIR